MLELLLVIAAIVAMSKIASADDQSPWLWGIVTFLICLGCLMIPLPFVRVVIAAVLTFVGMIAYKAVADRPSPKRSKPVARRRTSL